VAWTFGEPPLDETAELAAVLRRVVGLVLAQETPSDEVQRLTAQLRATEAALQSRGPRSSSPRIGDDADPGGRVYLDHSRDIGAFNPVFPLYDLAVDGDLATGAVEFPLAYEGPPGVVHGGFVAVFFDCVVQHHNCDVGVAGKTTRLDVAFRRPTPLQTPLSFEIRRTVRAERIESEARLRKGDTVCAVANVEAIAGDRAALPSVSPRQAAP